MYRKVSSFLDFFVIFLWQFLEQEVMVECIKNFSFDCISRVRTVKFQLKIYFKSDIPVIDFFPVVWLKYRMLKIEFMKPGYGICENLQAIAEIKNFKTDVKGAMGY